MFARANDALTRAPPARKRVERCVTMRNRILFERAEIDARTRTVTLRADDARATHAREVLRSDVGDRVRAGTIDVGACEATIATMDDDKIVLKLGDDARGRGRPEIDLLLATPRPKVLRRLWAPLASLGLGRVVLANAQKVERYYFDSKALDAETIRGEILRGLEQVGDFLVPQVGVAMRLPPVVDRLSGALGNSSVTNGFEWLLDGPRELGWDEFDAADVRLLAHPGDSGTSVAEALEGVDARRSRVLIAVGPEGGWTDYELDLFEGAGFKRVGLGTRTFTTDVACISLVSAVRERLQSWS